MADSAQISQMYRAASPSNVIGTSPGERRQRSVYGSYCDIDAVTEGPSHDYSNWIAISKEKLKERETKLTEIKMKRIQHLVDYRLAKRQINRRFIVPSHLWSDINLNLSQQIDEWKGVYLQRVKKMPTNFREYFVTGKNWWDSVKRKYIGSTLWIRVFECIERVK